MLSSSIGGRTIESCLMNAAGCVRDNLTDTNIGAIVGKTGTFVPMTYSKTNMDKIYLNDKLSINSVGLENEGYQAYLNRAIKYSHSDEILSDRVVKNNNKPYIQSIYYTNITQLRTMLFDINETVKRYCISIETIDNFNEPYQLNTFIEVKNPFMIELNISCPNVPNNLWYNDFPKRLNDLRHELGLIYGMNLPYLSIGLKMPPLFYTSQFDQMASILLEHDEIIDFITCCNTIPNALSINLDTKKAILNGSMGGPLIKPLALANVHSFHKRLNNQIQIIGCGGINTGTDALEYILCGASAVQIGTQLLIEGSKCFDRIENEMIEYMIKNKIKNIFEICGKLSI